MLEHFEGFLLAGARRKAHSMESVRKFAGDEPERVVEPEAGVHGVVSDRKGGKSCGELRYLEESCQLAIDLFCHARSRSDWTQNPKLTHRKVEASCGARNSQVRVQNLRLDNAPEVAAH